MFVDSHAHLTSDEVFGDIADILHRAKLARISAIINICTDTVTLERGIALRSQYPSVYNAAATTPHDVDRWGEEHFEIIASKAREGQLVAIGETGLDYHYTHSAPEMQKHFLIRYLQLAKECALPVIIHCRDAFSDLFSIFDQEYQGKAILHCFTGSLEEAKEVVKRGLYLSLSGIVTFKKSETLRKVAVWVPLDQLLIETDTPYLAPQPYRGKRNEPAFLVETAKAIAALKGLSLEELAFATENNAKTVFNL
jgi:TatD DNase family protein